MICALLTEVNSEVEIIMSLEDVIKAGLADIAAAIREGNASSVAAPAGQATTPDPAAKPAPKKAAPKKAKPELKVVEEEAEAPAKFNAPEEAAPAEVEEESLLDDIEEETDDETEYTYEEVVTAFRACIDERGVEFAKQVMSRHGVSGKLVESSLKPEKYAVFIADCKAGG